MSVFGVLLPVETVIAGVLLAGCLLAVGPPGHRRMVALAAQALAFAGTLVGVAVVIVGVGPQTLPDKVYHLIMVMMLVSGIVLAARAGTRP